MTYESMVFLSNFDLIALPRVFRESSCLNCKKISDAVDEAHCVLHWKYESVCRGCESLNND